jgi:WD40 repeat protein
VATTAVWDLRQNREAAAYKPGTVHFQDLAFSRDGRFLAAVSNDATVRIWDAILVGTDDLHVEDQALIEHRLRTRRGLCARPAATGQNRNMGCEEQSVT